MSRPSSAQHNPFHVEPAPADRRLLRHGRQPEEADMNADQILSEIREANLSYLMLAQSLIRTDREQALYRLGISEESASMIALLAPSQMMKIASGNTLLCRFRMDDDMVWGLLTNHGKSAANEVTTRLHASILMAGRHQEAA
jgi:flagellar transcriptional activator FlhD